MKIPTAILIVAIASAASAQSVEVPLSRDQHRALASWLKKANDERAKKYEEVKASRQKHNDEVTKRVADTNLQIDEKLPRVTAAQLGLSLLPELSAKDAGLQPLTTGEILLALAGPSIESELKALNDAEAKLESERAVAALRAIKDGAADCAKKATEAGLTPAKVCGR